jgi:hypothetical protein
MTLLYVQNSKCMMCITCNQLVIAVATMPRKSSDGAACSSCCSVVLAFQLSIDAASYIVHIPLSAAVVHMLALVSCSALCLPAVHSM